MKKTTPYNIALTLTIVVGAMLLIALLCGGCLSPSAEQRYPAGPGMIIGPDGTPIRAPLPEEVAQ